MKLLFNNTDILLKFSNLKYLRIFDIPAKDSIFQQQYNLHTHTNSTVLPIQISGLVERAFATETLNLSSISDIL